MDIPLGGEEAVDVDLQQQRLTETSNEAETFLKRHRTAKIVVIIDTHCLDENGAFVYTGHSPDTYKACLLPEVSGVKLQRIHSLKHGLSTDAPIDSKQSAEVPV